MNRFYEKADIPELMAKGKSSSLQKGPSKETAKSNYRPITCPPMIWEILTAQIKAEIFYSLINCSVEELTRSNMGTRGTKMLLNIDQHILMKNKTRRKNVCIVWIYYKKSYYIVQQIWLIDSQKCTRHLQF